jgi:hypothetical protein
MSEEEVRILEDKTNYMLHQLDLVPKPIPQAPPPTQVEEVEQALHLIEDANKQIRFQLNTQLESNSTPWARKKAKREHRQENSNAKNNIIMQRQQDRQARKWIERNAKKKEATPSIVVDSGATSTCIREADKEFVEVLETNSSKIFLNANGTTSKAGKQAVLNNDLRRAARDADIVPGLAMNSLLSTSKLADSNYITVFDKDEVKIFDAELANFKITGTAVLKGWRCPTTKLWRVPLQNDWNNLNTQTTLLSEQATQIIEKKKELLGPSEFVNSVYELPNTEQVVAWYHAAAGYPTKATWLKAIDAGFYATWPLLTSKAVKKHFPEHDETPKGHMCRVKSGVRSTKAQVEEPEEIQLAAAQLKDLHWKHRDIYVQMKDASDVIFTDQTG